MRRGLSFCLHRVKERTHDFTGFQRRDIVVQDHCPLPLGGGVGPSRRRERQPVCLFHGRCHRRCRLAHCQPVNFATHVRRPWCPRRSDRVPRHLHRRQQFLRCSGGHTGPDARPGLVEHLHGAADYGEPARFLDCERELEADRYVDLPGQFLLPQFQPSARRRQPSQTRKVRSSFQGTPSFCCCTTPRATTCTSRSRRRTALGATSAPATPSHRWCRWSSPR